MNYKNRNDNNLASRPPPHRPRKMTAQVSCALITSPDATQLNKTVLLSGFGSGDAITLKTQLDKTVNLQS